jgi:hypothetical protein
MTHLDFVMYEQIVVQKKDSLLIQEMAEVVAMEEVVAMGEVVAMREVVAMEVLV